MCVYHFILFILTVFLWAREVGNNIIWRQRGPRWRTSFQTQDLTSTPVSYPLIRPRLFHGQSIISPLILKSHLVNFLADNCHPLPSPWEFPKGNLASTDSTNPHLTQPSNSYHFTHLDHTRRRSKVTPFWERTRLLATDDIASHSAVGVMFIQTRRSCWVSRAAVWTRTRGRSSFPGSLWEW